MSADLNTVSSSEEKMSRKTKTEEQWVGVYFLSLKGSWSQLLTNPINAAGMFN